MTRLPRSQRNTGSPAISRFRRLAMPRAKSFSSFATAPPKTARATLRFSGPGHTRTIGQSSLTPGFARGVLSLPTRPYQPEIAQGTLQSIFEFQSMICELTGMDVANASMYDGSTGSAEGLMMAVRVTGRHKSVIATSVHPEYREVITTYARHQGMPLTTVGTERTGASIGKRSTRP